MFLFAFVFLFHLSTSSAGDECPTGTDAFKVCACSQKETLSDAVPLGTLSANEKYTVLECKNIASSVDFEQDLSKFSRRVIDKLIIRSVVVANGRKLARLPSSSTKDVRIRMIEILDSNLFSDFLAQGNPLENLSLGLLSLAVRKCSLHGALTYDTLGTVNTKNLDKLAKVMAVDFSDNYLTIVSATAFQKSPAKLATIDLSKNEIYLIQPGAFGSVVNLQSINLSSNYMETIDRSIFATPARKLEKIDLGSNSLKTLPLTFFNMMPVLKEVNLANNFLHSLPENPWKSIWNTLITLDVSGNVIECDCSLVWLPKMNNTGKTIDGKCVADRLPFAVTFEHELKSLTKEEIIC